VVMTRALDGVLLGAVSPIRRPIFFPGLAWPFLESRLSVALRSRHSEGLFASSVENLASPASLFNAFPLRAVLACTLFLLR